MFPVGTLLRRRGLGLLGKDEKDTRDKDLDALGLAKADTSSFTLEDYCGPTLNQLGTQSCVSHAIYDGELTFQRAAGNLDAQLGALMAGYYNSRRQHQKPVVDGGTYIRLHIKADARFGIVEQKAWPFNPWKINVQPDVGIYLRGFKRRGIHGYYRVFGVGDMLTEQLRAAIRSRRPTVCGIRVDDTFVRDDGSSHISWPFPGRTLGGHAIQLIGYKYENGSWWFRMKTSWGTRWRDKGYAWLHEEVVHSAWDHWVVDPS